MMLSVVDLIYLFKNIGDAWIKGMWARNFLMRGSPCVVLHESLFSFCRFLRLYN